MIAGTLDQLEARRRIDHFPRNRHVAHQQHLGIADLRGQGARGVVVLDDKAIAMVPILLISQVVLSNALTPLTGVSLWIAKLSMISFWGYDAFKSTLSAEILDLRDPGGAPLVAVLESYGTSLGVILLMTLAFLALVGVGLKLKDRKT